MSNVRRTSAWIAVCLLVATAGAFAQEAKLLATLKSNAPLKEKSDACRLLARIATKAAVPTLAALLDDEKLAHMARYALETLPDASVDAALRDALGKLKGRRLVGVISSLGVRRDTKAIPAIAKLLAHADAEVAHGAARALGSIGTAEAVAALQTALASASAANRLDLCEGILRCAESLAAGGKRADATAIYDRLRGLKGAPHHVRTASLRGAVLTRGKAGIPMLLDALRGSDYVLVGAAARTAMEMPEPEVTTALADELGKLPADKQILVTLTLGTRADASAVPALCALARKGEPAARVAAIRALPEIGAPSAAPVLVALLGDAEATVAEAARTALGALKGPEVDKALATMLEQKDPKARCTAVEYIGRRHTAGSVQVLLKAAKDADETVRLTSLKILADIAGQPEFPALVALLLDAKSASETRAAGDALSAICVREAQPVPGKVVIRKAVYGAVGKGPSRDVTKEVAGLVKSGKLAIDASNSNFGDPAQGIVKQLRIEYTANGVSMVKTVGENKTITLMAGETPAALVDTLCAAVTKASAKPKLALLRVLRSTGSAKALAAVRTATKDADADVSDAALSLLCGWPTVDALPDVTRLAKTGKTAKTRILALRGCIRLAQMQVVPPAQKAASLKEAMDLAQRPDEKRLALSALATVPAPEALAIVVSQLGTPALKEEASLAAVAIAKEIVKQQPAAVAAAMPKVIEATGNKALAKQAQALLAQSKRGARRK
ncbi:MAG: HEAT repeat domain-containing protein [Candidatus Brocadiae bacterium]|nr:HEAT repeat domain-containing protein [Candidatus Brocadiia bacterium]